jgi:hypothetical protein
VNSQKELSHIRVCDHLTPVFKIPAPLKTRSGWCFPQMAHGRSGLWSRAIPARFPRVRESPRATKRFPRDSRAPFSGPNSVPARSRPYPQGPPRFPRDSRTKWVPRDSRACPARFPRESPAVPQVPASSRKECPQRVPAKSARKECPCVPARSHFLRGKIEIHWVPRESQAWIQPVHGKGEAWREFLHDFQSVSLMESDGTNDAGDAVDSRDTRGNTRYLGRVRGRGNRARTRTSRETRGTDGREPPAGGKRAGTARDRRAGTAQRRGNTVPAIPAIRARELPTPGNCARPKPTSLTGVWFPRAVPRKATARRRC